MHSLRYLDYLVRPCYFKFCHHIFFIYFCAFELYYIGSNSAIAAYLCISISIFIQCLAETFPWSSLLRLCFTWSTCTWRCPCNVYFCPVSQFVFDVVICSCLILCECVLTSVVPSYPDLLADSSAGFFVSCYSYPHSFCMNVSLACWDMYTNSLMAF